MDLLGAGCAGSGALLLKRFRLGGTGPGSNDSKDRVKGKHRPASAIIHPTLIIALSTHAPRISRNLSFSTQSTSLYKKFTHFNVRLVILTIYDVKLSVLSVLCV